MFPNPRTTRPSNANRSRPRININSLVNKRINEHIHGRSFKPSPSPPVFQLQPWNEITARDKLKISTTELTYSISKLANLFIKQVGLYTQVGSVITNCGVEFQIISITAWNITDTAGGFIRLLPIDFLGNTDQSHELASPACNAAKNQFAAVGYVFPSSHQQHVHYYKTQPLTNVSDDALGNLCIIDVNGNCDVELHVKLRWRAAYGANIKLDYVTVMQNDNLVSIPRSIVEVLDKIRDLEITKYAEETFHDSLTDQDFEELQKISSKEDLNVDSAKEQQNVRVLRSHTLRNSTLNSAAKLIASYVNLPFRG